MTEPPFFSVILPTRNRARLVGRAIASVLAQTRGDLELIVVDDASHDDTAAVLAGIADPRLRVVRLAQAGGAAAARNRGLAGARGALVAFQDSDDAWHPAKLERQAAALEAAGAGVVGSVCSLRQVFGERTRDLVHAPGVQDGARVAHRIVGGLSVGTVSLVARREAVQRAGGFDASLPRLQDIELCLRLAEQGGFVFLSDILQDVYFTADSISADAVRFADAITAIARRHDALFRQNRRGHSYQLYRAGKYYAFERRYREAVPLLLQSLGRNPANWRSLTMLVAIGLGAAPLLARHSGRSPA